MVRRRADLAETDDEATTRERIRDSVEQFIEDPEERPWVASATAMAAPPTKTAETAKAFQSGLP